MRSWLALTLMAGPASAQLPAVDVGLVPEYVNLQPGMTFRVGVHLRIPDGWHIYWTNPGRSGLPTTIAWRLAPGITATATTWPFPERRDSARIVSHVYRGDVLLISALRVDPSTKVGKVDLEATLRWGICREICIPQGRTATLPLTVKTSAPQPSPAWPAFAAAAVSRLPATPEQLVLTAFQTTRDMRLVIRRRDGEPLIATGVTFFPNQPGLPAMVLEPLVGQSTLAFPLPMGYDSVVHGRLGGVLVAERGWGTSHDPQALAVDMAVRRRGD